MAAGSVNPGWSTALTERGRTLPSVLLTLKAWGDEFGEVEERTAEAALPDGLSPGQAIVVD